MNIINPYRFGVAAAGGLLDQYTNAEAAYSMRELSNAWAGQAVVRIRRGGADQQDFTADEITDGTLKTFCDAGSSPFDGKIVTWYDQSGNGNDLSFTNRPLLYDGTSVITENTLPALDFVASLGHRGKVSSSSILHSSNYSIAAVCQSDSIALQYLVNNEGGGATGARRNFYTGSPTSDQLGCAFKGSNTGSSLSTWDRTQSLLSLVATDMLSGGSHTIDTWVDSGSNAQWTGTGLSTPVATDFEVSDGSLTWDGRIQEIVIWHSDQSSNRTGIETNINAHYSIYA